MIPFLKQETTENETSGQIKEYYIDFENGRILSKKLEGNEAIKIWIYKVLKTNRYRHLIYTWDFGQELKSLIGNGYQQGYINSEAKRYITEALSVHSKIKRCYNFKFSFKSDVLNIKFNVETVFGEMEVLIDV